MTENSDQADAQGKRLPGNVVVLGWASFLNDVASEMVYPLLPQFLIGFLGGNKFHLGIIEGVADSTSSLIKLVSGAWSDRVARRKGLVVAGYAVATVARSMIALVTAPWQLFLARTADRVGKGVRTSPRDALIADSTVAEQRGRAYGFHRAMDNLGAAIGPVLATAFLIAYPEQLRLLFLLTLIPGGVALGLLLVALREPRRALEPRRERFRLTFEPFDRNFRIFLLALVVFTLGNSSDAFLLVRAGEMGVPLHLIPMLWFVFHIGKSAGNYAAGRLVDRIGPRLPLLVGWLVYAAVYLAFGIATQAWHAWTLFVVYAVFYALTEPAERTLVANLVGPEHKGLAFGWYNFAIGVAALPASLLFGMIYQNFGSLIAFSWGAALAMVALLLLLTIRVPHEPRQDQSER